MRAARFAKFVLVLVSLLSSEVALAAPQPARPADALPDSIGVNVHSWYVQGPYSNWNQVISLVGDLKIRQVRDHWPEVAKFKQLYDATGAKLDAIMMYNTPGAQPFPPDALDVTRIPQAIADLKFLGNGLQAIEGPNEYDAWGGPNWHPDLLAWQSQLYAAVKAEPLLANKPVIAPSVLPLSIPDLAPYFDAGNLHWYRYSNELPSDGLSWWFQQSATHWGTLTTPRPVYVTETGYHNAVNRPGAEAGVSEAVQAKLINRDLFETFNAGAQKTFLYELVDSASETALVDREQHFGLARSDYTLKPAAHAIKNLIKILSDEGGSFTPGSLDYTITGGSASLHSTLLQKHDGSYWLALWQEVPSWDITNHVAIDNPDLPITIQLSQAMNAVVYRPTFWDTPIDWRAGVTSLNVSVPDDVLLVGIGVPVPEPGTAGVLLVCCGVATLRRARGRAAR